KRPSRNGVLICLHIFDGNFRGFTLVKDLGRHTARAWRGGWGYAAAAIVIAIAIGGCAGRRKITAAVRRFSRASLFTRVVQGRALFRLVWRALAARLVSGQTTLRGKPKPLPDGAVTHDWPSFLGPSHNAVSTETKLSRALPPPLVWEFSKGTGYASPAVAGDRLVFVHRVAKQESVEGLHAETGSTYWQFRYGTPFQDRYGYNHGRRASPVLAGERVYTVGAEGTVHCLELGSGKIMWKRDLRVDYKVPQDFFGTASTPLVEGRLLIVNVGAPGGPCVVGLDKVTGRE